MRLGKEFLWGVFNSLFVNEARPPSVLVELHIIKCKSKKGFNTLTSFRDPLQGIFLFFKEFLSIKKRRVFRSK